MGGNERRGGMRPFGRGGLRRFGGIGWQDGTFGLELPPFCRAARRDAIMARIERRPEAR
jgi:hypothetical protein